MKICSISQESPPGRASWEQAVGRAVPGESPKIPDTALLRSRSVVGAMVGSAPNPRDERRWPKPPVRGDAAEGGRVLQPQASGSWLCSLRAVETELVLRPGESSCVCVFPCFLVASCMFYPFPTVYLRLLVVAVKYGEKREDCESSS